MQKKTMSIALGAGFRPPPSQVYIYIYTYNIHSNRYVHMSLIDIGDVYRQEVRVKKLIRLYAGVAGGQPALR